MAKFTLEEVMQPSAPKKYTLDEVVPKKPPSKIDVVSGALDLAYRLTPLGLLQTANEAGQNVADKERDYLGDKTLELTGSPAAATGAYMLPDILNLGVGNRVAAITPRPAPNNELGKAADRLGFKPSLPQVTGSRDLTNFYDSLANMPGSAGVIARHEARNQAAINKGVAKAIGEDADRVTGDVLANATDNLGGARNALRDQVNIPAGEGSILSAIDKSTAELKKSLRNSGQFNNDMERIKQGINSGNITGEQYQIWRTDLRDAADKAYTSGKTKLGDAYKTVLNALDDAARTTAGAEWKANDRAFSTLNMIQKGNIVNPVTGDVSAPLLANQFYRDFGKNAKQGKMPGEIADIATISKGYPTLKEGSATARRENFDSIVPWLLSPANWALAKLLTTTPYGIARNLVYGPAAQGAVSGLLGSRQEQTP